MTRNQKIVTVVGGSGFLGRYVVRELAKAGYTVRVITRHPEKALHLKTAGLVGQVVLQKGDITRPETLTGKLDGSFAVVNLVGLLYERGRQKFKAVHDEGAENLAKLAWSCGTEHFIQISALGASENAQAVYYRTKAKGEAAVSAAFKQATILRPGILFGNEDGFLNKFARMAAMLPFLPVIGGGKNKIQPVYVGDVARAVVAVLERNPAGKTYELGGPLVYTLREIMEYTLHETRLHSRLVPVPFALAKLKAFFLQFLPMPPLTPGQVDMLREDIVVKGGNGLGKLGVEPTAIEIIAPGYLGRYRGNSGLSQPGTVQL